MDIVFIFFILGSIILIGYFSELISKKFNVPSALFLLILGVAMAYFHMVDAGLLASFQPLFGTIALLVLLFDGGLSLTLESVIFKSGRVFVMAIITTLLAIMASILILSGIFGFDFLVAAIFGAIAGGIGSSTTISMTNTLSVPKNIKDFLTLESSITDVFSIVLTIVLTQTLVSGAFSFQSIGQGVLSTFAVGAFIGILAAVTYLIFQYKVHVGYNYMVTFGILLILFSLTEFMNGSGAIAVLIFGIILGNEKEVRPIFRIKSVEFENPIKNFQNEISFFVRTFFFVFLGITVSIRDLNILILSFCFIFGLYIIRYLALRLSLFKSEFESFVTFLCAVNPRGLATAVLATYPLTIISSLSVSGSIYSQLSLFPEIAFDVIVLSIVLTSVLVPLVLQKEKSQDLEGVVPSEEDSGSPGLEKETQKE